MIIASDLEGTLTNGSTWKAIGRYLEANGKKAQYRLFFTLHLIGIPLVRAKLLDDQVFRNWWMTDLTGFLKGTTVQDLENLAQWVVENELWPNRRVDVVGELEKHARDGHIVILSSGTWQPVLEVFARRIGAVALGTPLEIVSNRATGRLLSPMNTGPRKAASLSKYLQDKHLDAAYGDTHADIPMLELSATPVAVYPDEQLQKIAVARGWRILTA